MKQFTSAFDEIDEDSSGYIESHELRKLLTRMNNQAPTEDELRRTMHEIDSDKVCRRCSEHSRKSRSDSILQCARPAH